MFIAVTADGNHLDSPVSSKLEAAEFLLIVNTDNMEFEAVQNTGDPLGEEFAKITVARDCEAIITGDLTAEAFDILANACVTRYFGFGHNVKDSLVLMEQYALDYIKNAERTDDGCSDNHEGTCDGHQHEHD